MCVSTDVCEHGCVCVHACMRVQAQMCVSTGVCAHVYACDQQVLSLPARQHGAWRLLPHLRQRQRGVAAGSCVLQQSLRAEPKPSITPGHVCRARSTGTALSYF